MSGEVLGALIAATASVICQLIISANSTRKKQEADAVRDALLNKKIEDMDKKLEEHNHYAKRFEEIEKSIVRIETTLKGMKGD